MPLLQIPFSHLTLEFILLSGVLQELLLLEQTGEDKLQSRLIKICATGMDNSCATDLLLLSDFGPKVLCIHFLLTKSGTCVTKVTFFFFGWCVRAGEISSLPGDASR